jgi:hypothetical protein
MYRVLAFAALSCSSPDTPTLIASATNSASAITPRDTEPVNAETWTPDMAGGPYIVKRPREVPIASPMAVSGTPQDPTFWSQFVGTTPGDRPRAFAELCARGGRNVQAQQIAPGIRILVERAGLSCTLLVNEDPALPEAGAVVDALEKLVASWGPPDLTEFKTVWIDRKRSVDVELARTERESGLRRVELTWTPTTPLEKIVGTNGAILADLDVRPLVGKLPSALRPALPSTYLFEGCIDVSCSAFGLQPPGGSRTHVIQATFRDGETQVHIRTSNAEMPKLLAMIEASLGTLEPGTPPHIYNAKQYVVRSGGITYQIHAWLGVSITISHQQASN